MSARATVVFALLLAACGPAPIDPPSDLLVTRRGVPERVTFGAPFDVVVERTWPRGALPAPFDPASLAPLVVDRSEVARRADAEHERETWTLRVRALELGALEVPAPRLGVEADDGTTRAVRGEPDALTVVSGLPPDDGGRAELPSDVLDPPRSLAPRLVATAAVLALVVLLLRRRGREPIAAPPTVEPRSDLRARLDALRDADPFTPAEWDAFGARLAEVVREAVAAEAADTSEEVAARAPIVGDTLATCDEVKFGAGRPERARRERLVDLAADVVERRR